MRTELNDKTSFSRISVSHGRVNITDIYYRPM